MAKIQIKGGRRVVTPSPKATDKDHRAPAPRVKPPSSKKPAATTGKKEPKDKLTGLSIKQIMRATPPYIHNNGKEVVIKSLQEKTTKGGFPGVLAKSMSVTGIGNKRKKMVYNTTIIGKEKDKPLSEQKHVLMSCECDFFMFYCEYALTHWGSSKIKYCNGEPPVSTNPGLQPLCCKHLSKLAKTVLEHHM